MYSNCFLKSGINFNGSEKSTNILELMLDKLHRKKELIDKSNVNILEIESYNYEDRYTKILKRDVKDYKVKHLINTEGYCLLA